MFSINHRATEQGRAEATASPAANGWFTPGRFTLLLGGFIVAMFPSAVLGLRAFCFRDYGILGYPVAFFHRECFWNGEWPLWNPYNCSGIPHLAAWHTLTLYPFSLIYLLLPLPWSLSLFCLLHLVLAGLGMHRLVHQWTGNHTAAAFAGMAFAFNGLMFSSLITPNNMVALGWMPWVVWTAQRAWNEGRVRLLGAALAGTMQMLSGVPEIILLTWVLTGVLFLGDRPSWTAWRRAALVVILISGLAAAQLLPFFQLLTWSNRGQGYGDSTWSMPLWGWLNFVVPLFRCRATNLGVFYQIDQGWMLSYYVGVGTLSLALLACLRWRERRVPVLAAVAAVGLVLALGDQGVLYHGLRLVCPWVGFMRYPVKFVILPVFVLPSLAGLALAAWSAQPADQAGCHRRWLLRIAGGLLAVIAGTLLFSYFFPHPKEQWTAVWQSGLTRGLFLVITTLILLKLQAAAKPPRTQAGLLAAALVVTAGLDAWTHAPTQNPTASLGVLAPNLVAQQFGLKPMLGTTRVWKDPATEDMLSFKMLSDPDADYIGRRFGLSGNCNLLDHIPTPDGFYSIYPSHQYEVSRMLYLTATNQFPEGLASFLGIARITNPTNLLAWRSRGTALPMLTAGQQPVYVAFSAAYTNIAMPAFDSQRVVYLPPEAKPVVSVTNRTRARILEQNITARRITARVEAEQPGLLVIAQTWYPAWHAYVDGTRVPLWRANYAYQALQVPAGTHRVQVVYEDRVFLAGGLISLLTLAVMGAAWFRFQRGNGVRKSQGAAGGITPISGLT